MLDRVCELCGKAFTAAECEVRRGGGRFCCSRCWYSFLSKKTKGKLKTKHIQKVCPTCNTSFSVAPSLGSRKGHRFCSVECRSKFQTGSGNPNFKNRKISVKCAMCGNEFITGAHRLTAGRGKTCSVSCRVEYYLKFQKKNKDTSIERATEAELIRRGIPYMKQVPIKEVLTVVDFLLPNKTIVYCDGDYWHNLPHTKARGERQVVQLTALGYRVFRFWEHEINKDISACIDRIYQ